MSRAERIEPGPGQESVWDYPRPPAMERMSKRVRIVFGGVVLADSTRALRVLETSHPPNIYLPPEDIRVDHLVASTHQTHCEWKGEARYYDVAVGSRIAAQAAWAYPKPVERYADLKDHIAFYPGPMDQCTIDGEVVRVQEGNFYGGWITDDIVGPFKGAPGTWGW
ncbi:DUF427 domain-containing protein [Kolteria novifilia]|uniref:DUF427 domain-containing protein n=1 Tax=Kolteria novifilia TaxID=2527975 RepID=UPI003AF33F0C